MNNLGGCGGKLGTGARDKDRGEDEPLEWAQRDTVKQAVEIEGAEDLAVTALECIAQTVGEEGIARQALDLLSEQAQGNCPLAISVRPRRQAWVARRNQTPQQPDI
jgi:hypothetical protein